MLAWLAIALGCAHYRVNDELPAFDPDSGYRLVTDPGAPDPADRTFVILTFSGGGTRAAALSYGVLTQLRDDGLLGDVDVISSVSGGSFTAAYYGLFRERIFEDYERRFLRRDVQRELAGRVANPASWLRLLSPRFARIDLAAEYYDAYLFDRKQFRDLGARGRPFVIVNATDVVTGRRFEFTQDEFDALCSDLGTYPVARAVAASSAFPVAFSPLTLSNRAGACGYREPAWVASALAPEWQRLGRVERAEAMRAYTADPDAARWIHLVDGGLGDNIGLRGPLERVMTLDRSGERSWNVLALVNAAAVERLVVISVDARTEPDSDAGRSERAPGVISVVAAAGSVAMNHYSFDTVELFRRWAVDERRDQELHDQCGALLADACPRARLRTPRPSALDAYPIHVHFGALLEAERRRHFRNMSTSFALPDDQVAELIAVGREILANDAEYQRLVEGRR